MDDELDETDVGGENRIPEAHLWLSVLCTFTDDIVKLHIPQKYADDLMRAAQHEWAEMLCNMAGVDHDHFVTRMTGLHRQASKERFSGILIN